MTWLCEVCLCKSRKNTQKQFIQCFACKNEFYVHTSCHFIASRKFFEKRKNNIAFSISSWVPFEFPNIDLCPCCMSEQSSKWRWYKYLLLKFKVHIIFAWMALFFIFYIMKPGASFESSFGLIYYQIFFCAMIPLFFVANLYHLNLMYIVGVICVSPWIGWNVIIVHIATFSSLFLLLCLCYLYLYGPGTHFINGDFMENHMEQNEQVLKKTLKNNSLRLANQKQQCYICWEDDFGLMVPCLCKNMPVHESCLKMEMELNMKQNLTFNRCPRCQFIYQWQEESKLQKWRNFQYYLKKGFEYLKVLKYYFKKMIPFAFLFLFITYAFMHIIMIIQGKCSLLFSLLLILQDQEFINDFKIFYTMKQIWVGIKYDYLTQKENYQKVLFQGK